MTEKLPYKNEMGFFHFTEKEFQEALNTNKLPSNARLVKDIWHSEKLQQYIKSNNKADLELLYKYKEGDIRKEIFALCLDSVQEWEKYCLSDTMVNLLKHKYGPELPYLHELLVTSKSEKTGYETLYLQLQPAKQRIPMDWVYYAGYEEITPAVITQESNIEQRRLLMMEYGITKYLKDIKVLHEDKYGQLISTLLDDGTTERQKFVKVINGTPEPKESADFLRERGMLTEDGHKIYYIPVLEDIVTAKQGIARSWDIPEKWLPEKGFYIET